jgi:phage-related protein
MPEKCKVIYYASLQGNNPVKEFIESVTRQQKAKIFKVFYLLQEYGLSAIVPHIKKITGTPFWEIRILGQDNIRIVYIVAQKDAILALHGFIKKTQKTPEKEINIALKRYLDWKNQHPVDKPKND